MDNNVQLLLVGLALLLSVGFLLKRLVRIWRPVQGKALHCGGSCSCSSETSAS